MGSILLPALDGTAGMADGKAFSVLLYAGYIKRLSHDIAFTEIDFP